MTAIILDTETTGIDEPDVIELGYMGPLDTPLSDASVTCLNFKPTKPITLGAMATHHIIDADLAEYPLWSGWGLPKACGYLVGHNVDFDWKVIGSPQVKRICTLALSRMCFPKIDSHTLSAMIYHLYPHGMARELVKGAHNAAADVGLCYRILGSLWEAVGRPDTWDKLWQISERARVPTIFSFGKYKGEPIAEIRRIDRGYINWCLSGKCDLVNEDEYLRKALTQ